MTTPWIPCFLATSLVFCVSSSEPPQSGPVLTRITEPVVHGEGPHWDPVENVLYYVDISGEMLHRYDPATKADKSLKLEKPVGLAVPIKGEKHKFVVGLGRDYVVLTWDWDSGTHHTSTLANVDQQNPLNRFNDGKADARGRVWAGTMGHEEPIGQVAQNKGALYRLDNDPTKPCTAEVEVQPVSISNANRRTVFKFGELPGNPDGMTIDAEGNLWIACWGGSQVIKVNPTSGELLQTLEFPASLVTSVGWGGPALDTLYVTTMRLGLTSAQEKEQPFAGSVWQVTNLNTKGNLQYPAVVGCKQD